MACILANSRHLFDKAATHCWARPYDHQAATFVWREIAPGLCKSLEYIYPTDIETYVFYRVWIILSKARGQHGYPLIGACHVLFKRMVHESLGIVLILPGSALHLHQVDHPVHLDIAPAFVQFLQKILARRRRHDINILINY